ncbi:AAA family ATPase [Candidatus Woesearchaeota archaeon]|nr:AAA family ATPase [Candidatus Woesearchaeota archaeon]
MTKIIAVVGMTGSGKSEASDYLVSKGYQFLRFGQITLDIVKQKRLEPTEENEVPIRESIREEHGMGAYATLNIPKIDELLDKGSVVVDGLYSWTEYKILKEKYKEEILILAVVASPNTRYARLSNRELHDHDTNLRSRPASVEQARSRDYSEIENIEKAGPIAMADKTILNEGSVGELKQKIDKFLESL